MINMQRSGLALATSLVLSTPLSCSRQAGLSLRDQTAIYAAALAAASDSVFRHTPGARLLLDPRLLPDSLTPRDSLRARGALLDPRVVRQLPVEAVCAPSAREQECANGVRGLAARLSVIRREARDRASLWLVVAPVRAAGDNTVLLDPRLLLLYRAVEVGGRWRLESATSGRSS